jgi:hypothetical protein
LPEPSAGVLLEGRLPVASEWRAGHNAVYLASMSPDRDAAFISAMFGGDIAPVSGGMRVSCGPSQEVRVLTPQTLMERDPAFDTGSISPALAGISVVSNARRDTIPASEACGMFTEWAAS